MNLIEQLGGYECALYEYKNTLLADDFPYVIKATGTKFTRPELGTELLEHRHQHNIFEVGDKVVLAQSYPLDTVHEIERIENLTPHINGSETTYFLENSLGCGLFQIKHATDEEIKAGKRLEIT